MTRNLLSRGKVRLPRDAEHVLLGS